MRNYKRKKVALLCLIGAMILECVGLSCWFINDVFPKEEAKAEIVCDEFCRYLVANMPELSGANPAEVCFSVRDGSYRVYLDDESFIVNDAAVQNNIAMFIEKHGEDYGRGSQTVNCFAAVAMLCLSNMAGIAILLTKIGDLEREYYKAHYRNTTTFRTFKM